MILLNGDHERLVCVAELPETGPEGANASVPPVEARGLGVVREKVLVGQDERLEVRKIVLGLNDVDANELPLDRVINDSNTYLLTPRGPARPPTPGLVTTFWAWLIH